MLTVFDVHLYQTLYSPIIKTFFAFLLIVLLYILLGFLAERIERKTLKKRYKTRLAYVMTFVFLGLLVHIWLRGFGAIFAVIGVALAAIIIANKESVMNFTGFLIIQWRQLFTEGDHVQVGAVSGEVRTIGLLYLALTEYVNHSERRATGRTIYVPNGLVITGQIINYSQTSHLMAYSVFVVIEPQSDLLRAVEIMKNSIESTLAEHYENKNEYSKKYLERKDRRYAQLVNFGEGSVDFCFRQEKPYGLQLKGHYYCYSLDHDVIERAIYTKLILAMQKEKKIELAYSS